VNIEYFLTHQWIALNEKLSRKFAFKGKTVYAYRIDLKMLGWMHYLWTTESTDGPHFLTKSLYM